MTLDEILTIDSSRWQAPQVPENIPHGDMPGDKVHVDQSHVDKMSLIFPSLLEDVKKLLQANPAHKAVITVCGGSGVGKSESASVLAWFFNQLGVGAYVMSGDNYPRRIPMYNDAERISVFRHAGIRGLMGSGLYTAERAREVIRFQQEDVDASPAILKEHPWMEAYQKAGRAELSCYLGTEREQGFEVLSEILAQFKQGRECIWLKRMGRTDTELWYDAVDFSQVQVLILEWTHGNSDGFSGVDIPVLLNSTPQETAAYRKLRARDGKTDSPFTTMVLEIEQAKLESQAKKARYIITKDCRLISYPEYKQVMADDAAGKA